MTADYYFHNSRHMESETVIIALDALAQSTRLEAFRLLVKCEPDGLPAGEIAQHLAIPHNTLSSHLSILAHAGLVRSERRSRSIIYRADLTRFREVAIFLLKDCCGGRPEVYASLVADLAPRCHSADNSSVTDSCPA